MIKTSGSSILKQFDEYLKKNMVKDLICSTTIFVLICESSHTDELKRGLPLVGSAGKSVSRYLGIIHGIDINQDIGIGEYLASQKFPSI